MFKNLFQKTDERVSALELQLNDVLQSLKSLETENLSLKEQVASLTQVKMEAEAKVEELKEVVEAKEEAAQEVKVALEEAVESLGDEASRVAKGVSEKLAAVGVESVEAVADLTISEKVLTPNELMKGMSMDQAMDFWNKNKHALIAGTFVQK